VDKFGLKPWEIARLTDKQIQCIYFHARDEHGVLVPPTRTPSRAEFGTRYDPPESLEAELQVLADLNAAVRGQNGKGLTNYAEAVEQVRGKWADGTRQRQRAEWDVERAQKKGTDGEFT